MMTIDEKLARIRVYRSNIARYRQLLRSELSGPERSFIEKQLLEEQDSLKNLAVETFPLIVPANHVAPLPLSAFS